jgi:hypothetical protein
MMGNNIAPTWLCIVQLNPDSFEVIRQSILKWPQEGTKITKIYQWKSQLLLPVSVGHSGRIVIYSYGKKKKDIKNTKKSECRKYSRLTTHEKCTFCQNLAENIHIHTLQKQYCLIEIVTIRYGAIHS